MYKLEFELVDHPNAHHFFVLIKETDNIKATIKEETKYWKTAFNTPVKCINYKQI